MGSLEFTNVVLPDRNLSEALPTQSLSISTETERWSKGSDRMRRRLDLTSTTVPSSPASGPRSTETLWPTWTNGQGPQGKPEAMSCWMDQISRSETAVGVLPIPTIDNTPGETRMESFICMSNLQNVYPGNSGTSTSFTLSDQRRLAV